LNKFFFYYYSCMSFSKSVVSVLKSKIWPSRRCVRVLMYHKVSLSHTDALTVNVTQLADQLQFLNTNGYEYISVGQLNALASLPSKPVLLTFDDAYLNNLEHAYPVLKKHKAKATLFVPTAYVGKSSSWDPAAEPLLSVAQLKALDQEVFELGLHSHTHCNFKNASESQIREELTQNIAFFTKNSLPVVLALAYPYGGRPKNPATRKAMYAALQAFGVAWGFRIGNRLNYWPFANRYEMQRLDIRGDESFNHFKKKVKWGKWL
jgi:peptidoglycan/xylan/chitin deacetylase (PgdA/CDA1 family)